MSPTSSPPPRTIFEPSHVYSQAMILCLECGEVAGEWSWSDMAPASVVAQCGTVPRNQLCRCEEEWRQERGLQAPQWPGFDFARAVELCHCCAIALISSGQDDAPWFCPECAALVAANHDRVGQPVFPVGRTVATNRTLPLGAVSGMASALQRHARATQILKAATERVRAWRKNRIGALAGLAGFDLRRPAKLAHYLGDLAALSADRVTTFGDFRAAYLGGLSARRTSSDREQLSRPPYAPNQIGG